MSQLTPLKQKIKSIETTKKITHAVRLVSMSFYSRLEKQNVSLQHYKDSISQLFLQLIPHLSGWKNSILLPEDILDTTPLFIVISSAKGLCGSFNSNLFRSLEKEFFIEEHQIPTFITIGQKATKFINEKKWGKIETSFNELTLSNIDSITDDLIEKISDKNIYSSVTFYSNHFKNFFVQKPQKTILTPINLEQEESMQSNVEFIWEQSKEEVLDYLAIRYLKNSILDLLFQSLISENASRFIAMDNSTTNAEKYLEDLTLQYNKSRQTLITQEVSELSTSLQK